jgi:nucleoside-diphosphate-sugar epimerase
MRIFLAGASGAIGRQLVPLLASAGHTVAGTTRSEAKAAMLRELGAEPVFAGANAAEVAASNARIRDEGTANLIAAARAAGAGRFLAQSIAFLPGGGRFCRLRRRIRHHRSPLRGVETKQIGGRSERPRTPRCAGLRASQTLIVITSPSATK